MSFLSFYKYIVLCLVVLFSGSVLSAIDVYDFDDESKRADFVALTKELRCPKCQNQDIADSNAPIAKDMRTEVHRLLEQGEDKESIIAYMIERFGEFVTYKPKVSSETYLLWYGPWLLIVLGVIVIFSLSRVKNKQVKKQSVSTVDVKALLKKYDDEK